MILTPTTSQQSDIKDEMILVYVPEGDFLMGSERLTRTLGAYWIDKTEVTNVQYKQCVLVGPCTIPVTLTSHTRTSYYTEEKFANFPVINISWYQADTYCTWAGRRLPTEEEWEKAARGTDGRIYPWGDDKPTSDKAKFGDSNNGDTTAVDQYSSVKSPYGALNMAGNVREWTYSLWPGDNSGQRIIRGGSWNDNYNDLRAFWRSPYEPKDTHMSLGFRCAQSVAQ